MSTDSINEWVGHAKSAEHRPQPRNGVTVVRREPVKSRGAIIMEMADKLRPFLTEMFKGKYTDDGMLIQPAHIRGLALDVADSLLKKTELNQAASA